MSSDKKLKLERLLLLSGFLALVLSALLLAATGYLTAGEELGQGSWDRALTHMGSRLFGITGFFCGSALLVFEQWRSGTLLLLGAILLPCISFFAFGSL